MFNISSNTFKLPLVEKYRPNNFDQIIMSTFLKNKFDTIIKSNIINNMIFAGEPSTGKTSMALFLSKHMNVKVLELNASDDRGLNIINDIITPFCKRKIENQKIIILDEADSITSKAQHLLTNLMDDYNTKFIFICNEWHKIDEEIQSRCIIIHFPYLKEKKILNRLEYICNKENIKYEDNSLEELILLSDNDIRQCINNLEIIISSYNVINSKHINNILNKPKLEYITNILKFSQENNLEKLLDLINIIFENGFNGNDILLYFMKYIESSFNKDNSLFLKIYEIASKYYIRVNNGIDTKLQLFAFVSEIFKAYQETL
jgi:replication factor C subunit 2/4